MTTTLRTAAAALLAAAAIALTPTAPANAAPASIDAPAVHACNRHLVRHATVTGYTAATRSRLCIHITSKAAR